MKTGIASSTEGIGAMAGSLRHAIADAANGLVERETLVELIVLAAVAQEHLLVIGPPGTAKSVAVHRVAETIGGRYFEYLLGRFTEPNEIFGPVDLRKLKEGVTYLSPAKVPSGPFRSIDLVVSDVMMPDKNGIEVAAAVREKLPKCKTLLFSGSAAASDLLKLARQSGYKGDILAKPVHPSDLLVKLDDLAA